MDNPQTEKAIPDRTNAGDGITVWDRRGGVCCPAFFAISQKIFEMSELCNNSACFSVEIKGTSDIQLAFLKQLLERKLITDREYSLIKQRLMKDYRVVSELSS